MLVRLFTYIERRKLLLSCANTGVQESLKPMQDIAWSIVRAMLPMS